MRRALVIVNEHSRSGAEHRDRVIEALRAAGIEVVVPPIARPADIGAAIRAHRAAVDCVVLGGGDGTLQCAAGALAGSGLTLGIVPLGTANDLARTLELPLDLEEACAVIARGHRRAIDLGLVNGRHYFNVANVGLGVEVRRALSPRAKRWWGALSYARAAFGAWRRQHPFQAIIEADGRAITVPAIQIAVGNGRCYGGGMAVHEEASIDDGLLDLYAIRPKPFWRLIGLGPLIKHGRLDEAEGVVQLHARAVSVSTPRPMEITADGETIGRTPARFGVLPASLHVYVK
ncbi:MAG TPA: lipid kinase [Fibrobacteria bacterium]|nr:lipid kinase [Fibrobacteria bacterium]